MTDQDLPENENDAENLDVQDDPDSGSQFLPETEDVLTGEDAVTPELRLRVWNQGYGVVRKTDTGWKAVKRPS